MENNYEYIVFLVVLALMAREFRRGKDAVKSDPTIQLQGNERFRTLTSQLLDPVFAFVVVGSILLTDLERDPVHAILAGVGGVAGFAFGAYRARSTYVASVPAHKGLILRFSVESFVALGLLIVIKLVAEQNLLPDADIFRLIIAGLLGFLLVESCARVFTLVRYYRRDGATAASATRAQGA